MEKTGSSQLELFTQPNEYGGKNNTFGGSFLGYIRNYEKIIILLICFIITGIITFSLGVEKGKHIAILPDTGGVTAATVTQPQVKIEAAIPLPQKRNSPDNSPVMPQTQAVETKNKTTGQPTDSKKGTGKQNFTIQLASYKNKLQVEKEIKLLKQKGYIPFTLKKGKYLVLCIGKFNDKQTAETLLTDLKIKYQGCFIRRL
jgi:cell division septation protein DedD